jgi:hypothetical protein
VDDFPSVGKFAKDESEEAVGSFAVGHGEVIFAADEGGVGAERLDAQIREFQFSHLLARAGVGGAVVVEGPLPSAIFVAAGKKCQVGGIPVSGHKRFEIVTIPSFLLGAKYGLDGDYLVHGNGVRILSCGGQGEDEDDCEFVHGCSAVAAPF